MHPLLRLPPEAPELAQAWADACFDPRVDAEIRAVHAACAAQVAQERPLCIASGQCCRFEAYGHRLHVTGLEAAWSLRQLGAAPAMADLRAAVQRGDCPFLHGSQCGAHAARPVGCRTFYCDPAAQIWQQDLSERLHGRIRALHDALDIPYRYGDWRTMLAYFADQEPG